MVNTKEIPPEAILLGVYLELQNGESRTQILITQCLLRNVPVFPEGGQSPFLTWNCLSLQTEFFFFFKCIYLFIFWSFKTVMVVSTGNTQLALQIIKRNQLLPSVKPISSPDLRKKPLPFQSSQPVQPIQTPSSFTQVQRKWFHSHKALKTCTNTSF